MFSRPYIRWLLILFVGLLPVGCWGLTHTLRYGRTYKDLDWTLLANPSVGITGIKPPATADAVMNQPVTFLATLAGTYFTPPSPTWAYTPVYPARADFGQWWNSKSNTYRVWGRLHVVQTDAFGMTTRVEVVLDRIDTHPSPLAETLIPTSTLEWIGWTVGGLLFSSVMVGVIKLRLWRRAWRGRLAMIALGCVVAGAALFLLSIAFTLKLTLSHNQHTLAATLEAGQFTCNLDTFPANPAVTGPLFDLQPRPEYGLTPFGLPHFESNFNTRFMPGALATTSVATPLAYPIAALLLLMLWFRRTRVGFAPDLCQGCGYDIRASPIRCPECGLALASSDSRSILPQ